MPSYLGDAARLAALAAPGLVGGNALANATLVASVASNNLTVAIKTLAGNDPRASDPVYVGFRGATLTDGVGVLRTLTAAASVTIATGGSPAVRSTLGAQNGKPFRLWVLLFDDGGTLRLALVNCSGIESGLHRYFGLDETALLSSFDASTAIPAGRSGIGLIRSDVAVTAVPFRIVGLLTWNTGLATAGTWDAAPDVVQMFGPGMKKPGDLLNSVFLAQSAQRTGTTEIPRDNSIPQDSEGDPLFSVAAKITPASPANMLEHEIVANVSASAAVTAILALFDGVGADALAAAGEALEGADVVRQVKLLHRQLAETTDELSFRPRVGGQGGATLYVNGDSSGRLLGGVDYSSHAIREFMG